MQIPDSLRAAADKSGPAMQQWLAELPPIVESVRNRWSLDIGPPFEGSKAGWVAPARTADGRDAVVKVGWWHTEGRDEAEGLRCWGGRGTVEIYDAFEQQDTLALLLERCIPGYELRTVSEEEQDAVIADVLTALWIEPPAEHTFRTLQEMCDQWAEEFEAERAEKGCDLDGGLQQMGIDLFRSLPASAHRNVLLCTDLHASNVLAAQRRPWLLIDPKPHVGDPTYDLVQHMLNCDRRLAEDPHGLARRLARLSGVDSDRLLLWLFARCVQESPGWPGLAAIARQIAPS